MLLGSGGPSWLQNPKSWKSEGHCGSNLSERHLCSNLGHLGVILVPRLRILGQLGNLKGRLGHVRGHLAPKVGHKMPSRGSDPDRRYLKYWELDPRGGGRGRGIWQLAKGKRRRALDIWPEAGSFLIVLSLCIYVLRFFFGFFKVLGFYMPGSRNSFLIWYFLIEVGGCVFEKPKRMQKCSNFF